MVDTYDDIQEYIDEEEVDKKQKRWCIDRALKLAKKKKTKQKPSSMSDNDVVEAARKFNDFINDSNH
jgi:hypothetical protein